MSEKMDVLNRDSFIEHLITLVNLLSEGKKGCCFCVDGVWGSGKSFVMEKFENKIKMEQSEETNDDRYFVFHYDCWKYDYYTEPAIAIIAAMLDATDKELSMFSEEIESTAKLAWKTTAETLKVVAKELCKNKIGIDLVEVASGVLAEHDKENEDSFDSLYGFKRALEETRKNIQKIADTKTVVIVVDELDRCLPTYTIKVLERLHHIFTDLQNVVVTISMDKTQIEHSIQEIYGEIDVDTYLRKFISFKVNLNTGVAENYLEKYKSYALMFNIEDNDINEIETFFSAIMQGMDIRTQERIFRKAEIIHQIIQGKDKYDSSIMTFEILFLAVSLRAKSTQIGWLANLSRTHYVNAEKQIGKDYYNILKQYETLASSGGTAIGNWKGRKDCIQDNLLGKTFFWIAKVFNSYENFVCGEYFYSGQVQKEIELVERFAELINIIDND